MLELFLVNDETMEHTVFTYLNPCRARELYSDIEPGLPVV